MKKIVALLMVLAIVAGAFAADISAAMNTGIVPVSGNDNGVSINGLYNGQDALGDGFNDANLLYVSVDGEKAGAYFKVRGFTALTGVEMNEEGGLEPSTALGTKIHHYGVWFKPADMVKFTVGNHNTVYAFDTAHFSWWTPLGTGVDAESGWSVELTPIDALYIGLHFGDASVAAEDIADIPLKACFKFNIDGFGSIGLEGAHGYGTHDKDWVPGPKYNAFALGAEISAIENVGIGVVGAGFLYDEVYDPMFKAEVAVNASVGADIYFLSRTLIRTTANNDKFGEVVFLRADYYLDNFSIYGFAGFGLNVAPSGVSGFGGADACDVLYGAKDSTQFWAEIGVPISIDMVTVTPAFNFKALDGENSWSLPIRVSIEY